MAARTDLRKFQQTLIERLRDSNGQATLNARLGFEVGGEGWLVDLTGISEVLPVPALQPVPLARKWFAGVANIRGHLYSVMDFAQFSGQPRTEPTPASRLLLLNPRVVRGVALLVGSTYGLRHEGQFTVDDNCLSDSTPWIRRGYRDPGGRLWRELDPNQLAAHPSFLDVAA
jgi:twitching motility protein PilI